MIALAVLGERALVESATIRGTMRVRLDYLTIRGSREKGFASLSFLLPHRASLTQLQVEAIVVTSTGKRLVRLEFDEFYRAVLAPSYLRLQSFRV
jgi:hypothetical protein